MRNVRSADYYPQHHTLMLWISPNRLDVQPCHSLDEAKAIVAKSGVTQRLVTKREKRNRSNANVD